MDKLKIVLEETLKDLESEKDVLRANYAHASKLASEWTSQRDLFSNDLKETYKAIEGLKAILAEYDKEEGS